MNSATITSAAAEPMPAAAVEQNRARVLDAYELDSLDNDPELRAITVFAARLCEVPVSLVSMVEEERQRFLAREGIDVCETGRDVSFCAHAMLLDDLLEIPDATQDPRFSGNPLVTGDMHVRFYAGQPLVSEESVPLGSLCVIDTVARPGGLTDLQREGLKVLGQATMRRLRSRRNSSAARREQDSRESYIRATVDLIPAIAWSAAPDGQFDYFNDRMGEYTGDANARGAQTFHPDDWPKAQELWQHSLATGETYEVEHRLRRHDGEYRWMLSRAVPVHDADGNIRRWFGTAFDIHDLYAASERSDLLAKELSHRIKNIFAVVSGLISLSTRKSPQYRDFGQELIGTIHALGRAHDYVRPEGHQGSNMLHGLLSDLFRPYCEGDDSCVEINGHDMIVSARSATPLALVFHELATNSAKYGALSMPGGAVGLTIADRGDTLDLRWVETGAPPANAIQQDGFGSRLVELSVTGQLGGTWQRRFETDGMICELTFSKSALTG